MDRRKRTARTVALMSLFSMTDIQQNVSVASFDGDGSDLISLIVGIEPVQAGSGDPSPDNVRPISGWAECKAYVSPTTDPDDATVYSIGLDGTRYGGTLDVTTGKLTVDRAIVDLGSLSWFRDTSGAFYALFTNKKAGSLYTLCSELKSLETSFGFSKYPTYPDNIIGGNESLASSYFYCKATAYNDAGSFKAAMSGVMCVYELATPIEVDLTPTEINTLLGANNIWADTGEIKYIEYNV